MTVRDLLDIIAYCELDDEVVVVGKYGQLHVTESAVHCPPVLAVDKDDCVDVRGRLFVYTNGVRKYPVMTEEEKKGTGRYG